MAARQRKPLESGKATAKRLACPRRALEVTRAQVASRMEQLESELSIPPEIGTDEADPIIQENIKNFAVTRQLQMRLETINHALQAADRGEYGICERCGEQIPAERLRILPEARLCVRCKSLEEKSAKRKTA